MKELFNEILKMKDDHIERRSVMRHLCLIIFSILYSEYSSIDDIKNVEIEKVCGIYRLNIKTYFKNKLIKTDTEGNTIFWVHLYTFALKVNDVNLYKIKLNYDSNGLIIINDEELKINTIDPESKLFINMLIRECIKANLIIEEDIINHQYISDKGGEE